MTEVSEKGIGFIAKHEGRVLKAYRDVAGVLTIGYGHTNLAGTAPKVTPGMRITDAEALEILRRDVKKFSDRVSVTLPGVAQHVHDGTTSFDLNTGAVNKATWVKKYKAGDILGAEAGIMAWVKAGGRRVQGLVNRRNAERRVIFHNDYGAAHPTISDKLKEVREYQGQLRELGYKIVVDGKHGPKTDAAVRDFQRKAGLTIDGIVGPATRAALVRRIEQRKVVSAVAPTGVAGGGAGAVVTQAPTDSWEALGAAMGSAGLAIGLLVIGLVVWQNRGIILKRRSSS